MVGEDGSLAAAAAAVAAQAAAAVAAQAAAIMAAQVAEAQREAAEACASQVGGG